SENNGLIIFKILVSQNQQSIPRQNPRIGIPSMMYGFFTPTQWGFVHNIVVNQRKIVKQFDGGCCINGFLVSCTKYFGSEKRKHWSDLFATQTQDISNRLV